MNNFINVNIKSIEAFHEISEKSVQKIQADAEYLNFSMGRPILQEDTIPNKVLIIISGRARLTYGNPLKSNSASILSSNSFIGLTSLLGASGCEDISASTDLMVMAISDSLILEIYEKEIQFREWFNSNLQLSEVYRIAKILHDESSQLELQGVIDLILNNSTLTTLDNESIIKSDEKFTNIVLSGNIINKEIGDKIENNEMIKIRGNLPARIIQIRKSIFEEFNTLSNQEQKPEMIDIKNLEFNRNDEILAETSQEIGQYNPNKKFKVIKAKGELRESLACLQMISNQLNLPYKADSIEKILREVINKGKKPTLQILGGITSMMGLHSSIARIDPKMGSRIPSSSLIPWKDSFAVVQDSSSNFLEIVSPSEGIISLKPNQIIESFDQGFIEILLLEKTEQTPDQKFGLKWLLPVINRYRGVLVQVLFASAIVQLLGLANPLMIQVIIDKVISQRSLDTLQILGIAMVVVTILGSILSALRTYLFAETTNRIDTRLGAEIIDHLLCLPLNYFDKRPVGELGSRVAELEKIRNFLTGQALTTILDSLFSVIYIVIMFIYSWLLTIVSLIVVPMQMIITLIGAPLIRRQIREIANRNAKTQSHLVEVLTGVQTVKAQNVENISRWKWQELYSQYISKSFQKTIISTALGESSKVLQQLSQLVVLWIGAGLVLDGKLSLGQLIAFRIISGFVTQPLLRLSTIWQSIQELRVSFERLADIIDTPVEATEIEREKIPLPSIEGSVEFDDVSFTFNRNLPNVINKIDLKIEPGKFVGVVGQSGSGKSTLMKLLPRLYKPGSGNIKIDGYNIDKVELYSLRRQIGIVPQEPLLFAGTINENISLTDPEATSDEIVEASRIANAHDFIMTLNQGYSTNVGERGAGLSGGQKQRIAIARTILGKPKLLIMDEATSALDYETERQVCEGIRKACKGSTVFFITHRLSTVRNSDLIVMLHEGSIVEKGTHEELMNRRGRYFALYRQQEST